MMKRPELQREKRRQHDDATQWKCQHTAAGDRKIQLRAQSCLGAGKRTHAGRGEIEEQTNERRGARGAGG